MTKKELIEMLSEVPDDGIIKIVEEKSDLLLSRYTTSIEIKGYFESNGYYVLCGLNVRPYKMKEND